MVSQRFTYDQYGKRLTALILGETSGMEGKQVRVGDLQGLLVHESCGRGGA